MQRRHLLTTIVFLALALVAPASLAGCSHPTHVSTSPTWTPAASVSGGPNDVKWGVAVVSRRGRLLRQTWTTTPPIPLHGGPVVMLAQLSVPQSQAPSFVARLMPLPQPAGFAGYRAVAVPWTEPSPGANDSFMNVWFPYQLPPGRYSVMFQQVAGGERTGGSYTCWLDQTKQ